MGLAWAGVLWRRPGPFRDAMERDRAYLLRLDPDRLLRTFRLDVGLPSTARPYGRWESPLFECMFECMLESAPPGGKS